MMPPKHSDEECLVFQYVGLYLYTFARLEEAINETLEHLFQFNSPSAAIVASNLDLFKKLNVIRSAIIAEFSDENGNQIDDSKRSEYSTIFSDVMKANDERNIVAHSPFHGSGADSVIFERVTAKGALKRESVTWTYADIDAKVQGILELSDRLRTFVSRLTPYVPKLDFSDSRNSMYLGLIF